MRDIITVSALALSHRKTFLTHCNPNGHAVRDTPMSYLQRCERSLWVFPARCQQWQHTVDQSHEPNHSTQLLDTTSQIYTQYTLSILVNHFSPKLFLTVAKWVYQSIQRHTGLTHLSDFLTFGHSGTQPWVPECPNVKNFKIYWATAAWHWTLWSVTIWHHWAWRG